MELEMFSTYVVETIFIYFTKDCDDITGTESQFSLLKKKEPLETYGLLFFSSVCSSLSFLKTFQYIKSVGV